VRARHWGIAVAGWLVFVPAAHAAPSAVITSAPPDRTQETTATISFQSTAPTSFDRFQCHLDGGAWTACTSPSQVAALGGGLHWFEVKLVGLFANETPARVNWTVEVPDQPAGPEAPPAAVVVTPRPEPQLLGAEGCAHAFGTPENTGSGQLSRAVLCLLNHERTRRGLRALRPNGRLRYAAYRHAANMVRFRYFGHVDYSGTTLPQRVGATGYMSRARHWDLGEVLAWTSQSVSTPAYAVNRLMHSPPHRELILDRTFRQAGVWVLPQAPMPDVTGGATFVADFGRLRY
jgi:uncharacterized protein YkwD